ncbi:hypothetical protein LRS13_22415 [Svornostia abyssi]|uniref:Nitrite/Sulfite reductase ferredoxin-like domain-containing protein n=1 Tax=Svornostia abyssi TaxID=2898438 RepID=A0ABY5PFC4_9ACTN|nr:hypothetical protein LRS13_22415 [Parviterribacteraceae bacterium J379]
MVFDDLAPRPWAGATAGRRDGDDRCPGALRLHEAADGWLARVRVPGGRVTAAQALALADAAAEFGSGLVDITSRANLQLRGLTADAAGPLAGVLRAAGLLPSASHERVRNVLASPLAGRDPRALIDGSALCAALDRAICADPVLAGLSGRFQFGVEDGAGLLAGADVDVLLAAVGPDEVELVVGGRRTDRRADVSAAAALGTAEARAFLARAGGAWRISSDRGANRGHMTPLAPGSCLEQADGRGATTALVPLGRLDAAQLRGLARLAPELRVSPWRTVTLVDLPDARRAADGLRALGLVLDAATGWHRLTACAGLGACPRARLDVRAAARARGTRRRATDPPEHWSACPRRCGLPAGEVRAVTWTEDGIDADGRIVPDLTAALEAVT